jgi:hypothetical protein
MLPLKRFAGVAFLFVGIWFLYAKIYIIKGLLDHRTGVEPSKLFVPILLIGIGLYLLFSGRKNRAAN